MWPLVSCVNWFQSRVFAILDFFRERIPLRSRLECSVHGLARSFLTNVGAVDPLFCTWSLQHNFALESLLSIYLTWLYTMGSGNNTCCSQWVSALSPNWREASATTWTSSSSSQPPKSLPPWQYLGPLWCPNRCVCCMMVFFLNLLYRGDYHNGKQSGPFYTHKTRWWYKTYARGSFAH